MKNLKKIAALVIVLAMALSSVSFAAFTDVKEDASYNEAVTVMSALGLLKGYEDGTFGPDKTITRAEFAAVVVRMLGMEVAASGVATATNFIDVPATHWAAGYVKIANQKGIINGYGDGNFGPEDEVTYEQAIKMLVLALGYAPKFEGVVDAYPTAYMAEANALGMTVGAAGKIGDKATRAIVARLAYNALDDQLMEQKGYGSEITFEPVDKTLLSSILKVAKVDATVKPVGFTAEDANKVVVNVTDLGDEYDKSGIEEGEKTYDAVEGLVIPKGYAVTAFIDYNDEDMVVLAVVPKAGKNEVLELTATQMFEGELDLEVADDEGILTYYKVSSDESKATEVELSKEIVVYKNQNVEAVKKADYSDIESAYAAGNIQSLKLIENNKDNKGYDVLIYTEVKSDIVKEINDFTESVTGQLNNDIYDFDKEIEDQIYTLKDVNGKELSFADIKVGDIINVIESVDAKDKSYFEYIISSDKVEGTVTEEDESGKTVVIGDKEYKLADGVSVEPSDKGTFYVDIMGNIIYKELDVSSRTFGILYQIEVADGLEEGIEVTIYTREGNFDVFTLDSEVELNGLGEVELADLSAATKNKLVYDEDVTVFDVTTTPELVMYSANSSGEISSLINKANIEAKASDYYVVDEDEAEYSADYESIDDAIIVDSSVIVASKDDKLVRKVDNYSISSKAVFNEKVKSNITYIAEEATDELVYAIVYNATAKVEATNPVMVVNAVNKGETEDGDEYSIVKGYVNGELKSFNLTNDADIETLSKSGSKAIAKGALIQYNEGDFASAVRIIATAADVEAAAKGELTGYGEDYKDDETGYLVSGKVDDYRNGKIFFDGAESGLSFKSGTPTVKVTLKDSKISKLSAGYSISYAETKENYKENNKDVVIVYNYDRENMICVVIDLGDANKK
ncbi:MAG: S-layer homology domain-containing protein [Clostridia bacterium]|nr:S-layer homology domain-containing protein [Clostridia bacterium]